MSTAGNTFSRTLDLLGSAICAGSLEQGSAPTIEQLVDLTGASRIIVREATQVLAAAGLVEARQRVGIRILPPDRWNVIDPRVVGWRLRAPTRSQQIGELLELRATIEPAAARLAASRRTADDSVHLLGAANGMRDAALSGSNADFLAHDADFHRTLLASSGNSLFFYLFSVIETGLADRDLRIEDPELFDLVAVDLHRDVARQIERGRPEGAETSMLEIIRRTRDGALATPD